MKELNNWRAFPSRSIFVHERISTQRDKDGNYCSDGMSHVVRKYKGTGAERKDVPCAMTQVIISLQIRKRRQLSSTLGSERVISADASVTTVYCMVTDLVKWLLQSSQRIISSNMSTKNKRPLFSNCTINWQPYMACSWSNSSRKPTHNLTPHLKAMYMAKDIGVRCDFSGAEVCMCYTKRPKVIEDYFGL